MRSDPRLVSGSEGKLARYGLAMIAVVSLASTGLGQEADATTGSTGMLQLAARASGRAARTVPEVKSLASEIFDLEALKKNAANLVWSGLRWYMRTPAAERMSWVGLFALAGLGLAVLFERAVSLRRLKIIPADFTARFLDRLHEGKLDGGKALDYCEMNPSPAARVALAAVRRWGRPAVDLERAVILTHRGEAEHLRRNVGTLRRIAALAPLVGLLGSLLAAGRALAAIPVAGAAAASAPAAVIAYSGSAAWGPAMAEALSPLIWGLTIATLALVAYDSLVIRIERFSGALDRLGAETIDAIAMATQPADPPLVYSQFSPHVSRSDPAHPAANPGPARTPQKVQSQRRRAHDAVTRSVTSDHDIGF
jgi:biopolymer transport protein ExbB